MKIFVTGASGHIGSLVVAELLNNGHQVIGLGRSEQSVEAIRALGAEAILGSIEDLDMLQSTAAAADGVIHLAFRHELAFSGHMEEAIASDFAAIEAIGSALAGTNKPFVATSGTMMLAFGGVSGRAGTEEDRMSGGRADAENKIVDFAAQGVRSSIIRLPPTVHGPKDLHGFIPSLIAIAREKGVSGYVGEGANRWPAVHQLDAAVLYRLAVEHAPAGSRLHGVAEEGIAFKDIAEAIGKQLNVPVESIAPEKADEHFSFLGRMVIQDNPTSGEITQKMLDWKPKENTLIEDLEQGFYFK